MAAPAEVLRFEHQTVKYATTVSLDLRLPNPGDAPRWFVLGDAGEALPTSGDLLDGEPQLVRRATLSSGSGAATLLGLGSLQVIRVPPRAAVTLRGYRLDGDAQAGWTLRLAVADTIRVDGDTPLEERFPEAVSDGGAYDVALPVLEGSPDALARAWQRRVAAVHADLRERWVWRSGDGGSAWHRCGADTLVCAPVARPDPDGLPADVVTRITALPDDQLLDWLRAEETQVLANASGGSAWRLTPDDGAWLVLDGGRRSVTRSNRVVPVMPASVLPGFDATAWVWSAGWEVRDGERTAGEAGVERLGADGWHALREVAGYRAERNADPGEPRALGELRGDALRDEGIRIDGAMAAPVLEPLLTSEPVRSCYRDVRTRPGGEPLLLGRVGLNVDVGADGSVRSVQTTELASAALADCLAERVPASWKLPAGFDGQPYRFETTWLFRPSSGG